MSIIRNIMYTFDRLAIDYPALIKRQHVENSLIRQFFDKDGQLVQVESSLDYLITDEKPVKPYANSEAVLKTKDIQLPDLNPMNSLSNLFDSHVYRHENSFPTEDNIPTGLKFSTLLFLNFQNGMEISSKFHV